MPSYADIDIYLLLPLKETDGVLISGDESKSKSMALYLSSGRSLTAGPSSWVDIMGGVAKMEI